MLQTGAVNTYALILAVGVVAILAPWHSEAAMTTLLSALGYGNWILHALLWLPWSA